jgi:hypothetical protein
MVKFVEFPFMVKPMLPVDSNIQAQGCQKYRKFVFNFVFTIALVSRCSC